MVPSGLAVVVNDGVVIAEAVTGCPEDSAWACACAAVSGMAATASRAAGDCAAADCAAADCAPGPAFAAPAAASARVIVTAARRTAVRRRGAVATRSVPFSGQWRPGQASPDSDGNGAQRDTS